MHTSSMNLKNAALLALVGMILVSLLMIGDLINNALGVVRDLLPAVVLLRSIIYAFASVALAVFLWVFHRRQ